MNAEKRPVKRHPGQFFRSRRVSEVVVRPGGDRQSDNGGIAQGKTVPLRFIARVDAFYCVCEGRGKINGMKITDRAEGMRLNNAAARCAHRVMLLLARPVNHFRMPEQPFLVQTIDQVFIAIEVFFPTEENGETAFLTFNDPDGDGVNNTYAFTAAGGGEGVNELENMLAWFGPTDFYVTADGQVSHPILDGNYDKYADLLHTIVSEGLIDPDWYTQGWDDRKPNMAQDMFGIIWYPVVALNEEVAAINGIETELVAETGNSDNPEFLDNYVSKYVIMPNIGDGKLPAANFKGRIRTVSVEAAEDERKMDVIIRFLEDTVYNSEAHEILYGGPMQPFGIYDKMEVLEDGTKVFSTSIPPEEQQAYIDTHPHWNANSRGTWNWMNFIAVYNPAKVTVNAVANGTIDDALEYVKIQAGQNAVGLSMEKWSSDGLMVIHDATLVEDLNLMRDEYLFNRIMGNPMMDYDTFVQQWLDQGGQIMLDNATETFRATGLID